MKNYIVIVGARKFKGNVDDNVYDFTKISYFDCKLNSTNSEVEKGSYPVELEVGSSSYYDEVFAKENVKLPAIYEIEFELTTGRKGLTQQVLGLKPICDMQPFFDSIGKK